MKSLKRIALEADYRKLAKRADQRLVRLERLAAQKGFEDVTNYAYRVAMRDIRSWSGSEATRFNTRPPKNTNQLKAKIADIEKFLNSVSSTKTGIVRTYDNRVKTFNKKYGTDFSREELSAFFKSSLYKKMDEKIKSSDIIFNAIGEMKANKDQILQQFDRKKPVHLDIPDMHVKDVVDRFLRYYKKNVTSLFGSF